VSLRSWAAGLRTCIRRCNREKDGTPSGPSATISPSRTVSWCSSTVLSASTISGNEALKLLPLRDHSAGGLVPVVAIALTPSHFDSNALNCTNDERDKLPRVRLSK